MLKTFKVVLLCILAMILTSCVGASNWLSAPTSSQNSLLSPSTNTTPISIGVSTRQEIVSRFGTPTDQQIYSIEDGYLESIGYATAETKIRPYQYIPLFGAFAFWKPLTNPTPSAAISFSPQDVVSGITLSPLNAYGDIRSSETFPMEHSPISFYGIGNPNVIPPSVDSTIARP